ncbi:aminodeoxychorismate synthase component I [Paeniglutamicibacter sp. ANT13_2]|uniref:Aminodeoxychorismate synthase component I n=1 Tax=Paeniglutamicibacter terrestris TaxID=2723403 RepID=A0ABX1FZS1_9MICC|nr:chorismate-binding protein [Paeniglutamicibacter terrestris]NKG19253.1 aminodeoxychorismate synthase component I [Paeniglutamicibacter terrestris]
MLPYRECSTTCAPTSCPNVATSPVLVLGIDGRSGAGKSTLAAELATQLRRHREVALFHLEDIYPGWDGLKAGTEDYVDQVLTPLARGDAAAWKSWDWNTNSFGPTSTLDSAPVIIIEGVGAGCAAARELLDVLIYVQVPDATRKQRALERDGEIFAAHWEQWAEQENLYLSADPVPEHADITVDNRADGSAPTHVLRALLTLPAAQVVMAAERAEAAALAPEHRCLTAAPDAAALFAALYPEEQHAVLLESSNLSFADPRARNRYSIMAAATTDACAVYEHRAGSGVLRTGSATARTSAGFFSWLASAWDTGATLPGAPSLPFLPGWLGYLGYELKRETGGSNNPAAASDAQPPDAALIRPAQVVIIDHHSDTVHLLASPESDTTAFFARVSTLLEQLGACLPPALPVSLAPQFSVRDHRESYLAKVLAAKEQIWLGNSYEVCLTTSLHAAAVPCTPWDNYLLLRERNPAPFAHYLRFGDLAVASTSPERFLSVGTEGWLRAEPIKGTRPRGQTAQEDAALIHELETSPKDRAENIMIVDLLRNDLSHFAQPGTLSVPRLCAIESYATVHQMVSTIDAKLRPGAPRAEAIAAAFPAGSMTGAPKVSTMAILDSLEDGQARGLYSGSVGYFSATGAADLSVVIRTLVMLRNKHAETWDLSLGVGGAITADSDPQEEWDEVRTKAFGVLSALGSVFPGE